MTPTFRKAALILAIIGFGVSVLVAACSGDDEEAAPPATTTVETTQPTTTQEEPPPTTTEAATTTEPEPDPVRTFRITVEGGRPVGGIARPSVSQGDKLRLVVRSDVADHVHLHGYDIMRDVAPGAPAQLLLTADVPGRFEIELEDLGVQVAELEVAP